MRRSLRLPLLLVGGLLLPGGLLAQQPTPLPDDDPSLQVRMYDTIVLANGNTLQGTIVEDRADGIVFRGKDGIEGRFPPSEIRERILRNPPSAVHANRVRSHFDPMNPADREAIARWCLEEGIDLTAEAIGHLEAWVALEPAAGAAELLLPLYARRVTPTMEESDLQLATTLRIVEQGGGGAEVSLHVARLFTELGDLRAAIRILEPLAGQSAEDPMVRDGQDLLVESIARIGDREAARALAERLLDDPARESAAELLRLSAAWHLEDLAAGRDGAAEAFDESLARLLEAEPEDGRAHLWEGSAALLRGDLPAARASLKRAFELGEFGAEALATIALALAREGETQRALDTLASVRTAEGVEALVHTIESYIQEEQGDPAFASALLRDAIETREPAWQSWIVSIQGRDRLDETFSFDREVDRALEEVGVTTAAFAELSLLVGDRALRAGDFGKARRWLGYARSTGRALPELLLRVGLAEMAEGGDPRLARAALTEGLEADPGGVDLHLALGALDYREGDLEAARLSFERGMSGIAAGAEGELTDARRRYGREALEQIERAQNEEVWGDGFDRPDGSQVLNNWEKAENVGVLITIDDGRVRFAGTQADDEGLTRLTRVVRADENYARVRADFTIDLSTRARVGLRLARVEGGSEDAGIVVYRDTDGVIAVALNTRQGSEVIRSDGDGAALETEHQLVPTAWPTDGRSHRLELRLPRPDHEETGASVHLDGALVMSGIPVPRFGGRGSLVVGMSGQAEEGVVYEFLADSFEIHRRIPKAERVVAPR